MAVDYYKRAYSKEQIGLYFVNFDAGTAKLSLVLWMRVDLCLTSCMPIFTTHGTYLL